MISSKQKQILALLIIVVTLVNLGALATVLYKLNQVNRFHESAIIEDSAEMPLPDSVGPAFMIREIGFDQEQRRQMGTFRRNFRSDVAPVMEELRNVNADLVNEVMKSEPDTLKLQELCSEIGNLHAQMKLETMHHLLDIKQIATPEQNEKLKYFYQEMLSRGDGPQPDGKGHRHRRGWRNAQPNNGN
jgi:Spy/CpxP family protein refolding chaperone